MVTIVAGRPAPQRDRPSDRESIGKKRRTALHSPVGQVLGPTARTDSPESHRPAAGYTSTP